jgi:FkbM family methyltransferase
MPAIQKLWNAEVTSGRVRSVLRRYYRSGHVYRIPFGPLRGFKLRYFPAVTYHAMLGLRELDNFRVLKKLLRAGALADAHGVACDLGANVGLFSLWLSRYCVPSGRVFAFEPAPGTVEILRDTIALNGSTNIDAVSSACTDHVGQVEFFVGADHHCSSMDADWTSGGEASGVRGVLVDAITLDEFLDGASPDKSPSFLKIDIEGGAVQALGGCERTIDRGRPVILAESHNPSEDKAFGGLLARHDYKAFRLNNRRWVAAPTEVHPHPEGVWGNLLLCPRERQSTLSNLFS